MGMTAVSDPHQVRINARNRSPKARWEAANSAEDQETRIGVGGMRWRLSVRGWRVVFRFDSGDAHDVDLVDYH